MSRYDVIHEIDKSADIDTIEEVQKFNPFHDSHGRFSNKNGFASYSANPNTRAGAMAIARSAAAGHMDTVNVHREARHTGATIRANANWLGRGKQATPGQQGSATLRRRVEPIGGLQGASATGASWQHQNQMQGRTTSPGKQPSQAATATQTAKPTQNKPQPQKPAQNPQNQSQQGQNQQQDQSGAKGLAAKVSDVQLGAGDKLAIQPRDRYGRTTTSTTKVANDHYQDRVDGKDISKTADISKVKGNKDPIDKMAELQDWNKPSTVTNNLETFQKAAKKSGIMLIRTVEPNDKTGESADSICKKTMTDGNDALGGHGGKLYGTGLYMVGCKFGTATGRTLGQKVAASQHESSYYGNKQMMATVHPKAKIATPTQAYKMKNDFCNMSYSQQRRFGGDCNTYIASKGYDGARWQSDTTPYITMFNKSAIIYYGGVSDC